MKKISAHITLLVLFASLISACNYFSRTQKQPEKSENKTEQELTKNISSKKISGESTELEPSKNVITATEQSIINAGLVDIKTIDSTIAVDMKYSTKDNFLGVDVYGDFNKCYLQPDVAEKLRLAQLFLKTQYPYYSLIVYDAARPRSVQRIMWDTVKVPRSERTKYLSNPNGGSLHNFGAAVDISIIDENGITLDMGTPYDFFGEQAYPREEERMIREGKLTHKQLFNRELLRTVMQKGGFWGIATEWWHFNSCSREVAYLKYKIIE